jgi:hypothetical protein
MPTQGVILHAFGAGRFDYYALADTCARLVTKFLSLPITLVTDRDTQNSLYDRVIVCDSQSNYQRWLRNNDGNTQQTINYTYRNDTRSRSLEFSPYDRTILLDSDYLVLNSQLLKYLQVDAALQCPWRAYDVTNRNSYTGFARIKNTIAQAWATVVIFDKSSAAKSIFAHWRMIQDNYEYYRELLGTREHFRNDYALSLAAYTMTGCAPITEQLPPMHMLPGDSYIETIRPDGTVIINCDDKIIKLSRTNLHVMNKLCLQTPCILEDIDAITA